METIFQRYEQKYILSPNAFQQLMHALRGRLQEDRYGRYVVRNVYYDTDDIAMIRHSLSKPGYKEKLRMRQYEGSPYVFIELKKKVGKTVYKRRMLTHAPIRQIQREIEWFLNTTHALPKVAISYDRQAFVSADDPDLRITFDARVRFQCDTFDFLPHDTERLLFEQEEIIMEIKTKNAIPVWLGQILSALKIFPCSCSKYGMIYSRYLAKEGVCSPVSLIPTR
ncbi:polyphosphate polymerase domain-containing protein [uncultured Dubosiella sp.]|uniref:polyphosphate polymerase domain-containing protein n=2 Tax=uncultured Dubosiella sp. TaxID=1937011 RepID=UPI0025838959|nr:polyphosphate polymerase domain-containing protein [uncultured Dubosiella sp.]